MIFPFPPKKIGIIGGGQLARMMIYQSKKMGFEFHVLEDSRDCPAFSLADGFVLGSLQDAQAIRTLAEKVDVLTYDIEHINVEALLALEEEGFQVCPSPKLLKIIQNKFHQKQVYSEAQLPTAPYRLMREEDWRGLSPSQLPLVQKSCHGGYDGRGVKILRTSKDLEDRLPGESFVEDLVPFEKELGVMVARGQSGEVVVYPVVEMAFDPELNICDEIHSPAPITGAQAAQAQDLAKKAVEALEGVGIFGVELFLLPNGELMINEIAPRPHNSGHHTMEANDVCQFENHVRAVAGLPLGFPGKSKAAVMVNLLGEGQGFMQLKNLDQALKTPGLSLHLYGKTLCRPGRKMGHYTLVGEDLSKVLLEKSRIKPLFKVVGEKK
jgi:5-(carboxyamino)imidazole ribonucleotide synthase